MKNIFIYTMGFPYGNQETFLEEELEHLCDKYQKVYIVPLKKRNGILRDYSSKESCVVLEPIFEDTLNVINVANLFKILAAFMSVFPFRLKKSIFVNSLIYASVIVNAPKSFSIENIKKFHNIYDVHYFYWGYGLAYLSTWLRKSLASPFIVCRFHGFDLYENRHDNWLPCRKQLISDSDQLHFISLEGKSYFNKRYPESKSKSFLSYLGVKENKLISREIDNDIVIYSCSNVIPLKRVELIFQTVVALADARPALIFYWHHFGDGECFDNLKRKINLSSIPRNLNCKLHGRVTKSCFLSFYSKPKKSIFINLSTTEGLPVSIMEAIAFNIPVVATNVGGVSEVLLPSAGKLVDVDADVSVRLDAIINVLDNYNKFNPYKVWLDYFNSNDNYVNFSNTLNSGCTHE
ncbi:glycosyltransferase [Vibrio splendidus]|uniref:glycosyltransferase n=1 Tax=Vibrio splendidus TaxID=29497 RepID=UPI000D388CF2|nr:glycosyltransferase [Vibrio splendidus]PTP92711.1 hypothetical protein CWO02_12450 [Vibrio splendidus]